MTASPKFRASIAAIAFVALAGCSTLTGPSVERGAVPILGTDGRALGRVSVSVSPAQSTTRLTVLAVNMAPGLHGIHLHEKGVCAGPKFASAGGHWNPARRKHGHANPAGAHLGDLPNLRIASSGKGTARLTVAAGTDMLADADGTALVIHAAADDYRTDPSGNSGDRIACAVIASPR